MRRRIIPIERNPLFIIVTKYDDGYYHYNLKNMSTKNKQCDIGVWHIKYKK